MVIQFVTMMSQGKQNEVLRNGFQCCSKYNSFLCDFAHLFTLLLRWKKASTVQRSKHVEQMLFLFVVVYHLFGLMY